MCSQLSSKALLRSQASQSGDGNTEDGEEIVVSINDFVRYLGIACEGFVSDGCQDLQTIEEFD